MRLENDGADGCINFDAWSKLQYLRYDEGVWSEGTLHDGTKETDNSEDGGVRGADTVEPEVVVETEDTVLTTEEQVFVEDSTPSGCDAIPNDVCEEEDNTDSIVNSIPLMEVTYK